MPSKNSIKQYLKDGYYHIYNRGVEKRKIFQDEQDYSVFLSYLSTYLSPKNDYELISIIESSTSSLQEKDKARKLLRMNNYYNDLRLLCYGLMPNHYHFIFKQRELYSIDSFMNSLCTRYTMFFNKKYKRVGSLYQDVYKAVLIESDEQLLHLSRYIHLQTIPKPANTLDRVINPLLRQPSSLPEYCQLRNTSWIYSQDILAYFSKKNPRLAYLSFLNQGSENALIYKLVIEAELD